MKPKQPSAYHVWDGSKWVLDKPQLLADSKKQKIEELNKNFQRELAKGFTTSQGITLASTPTDYQFLAVGKERAKTKLEKGETNPKIARMKVKDKAGAVHKGIAASDYIAMIEELEEYLESLWYKKADLEEAAMNATTVAELEAVKWE
jgi:hexokinase